MICFISFYFYIFLKKTKQNKTNKQTRLARSSHPRLPLHQVRLYETLFNSENPNEMDDWLADINSQSLQAIPSALGWATALKGARPMDRFQFERLGYFCCDKDSTEEHILFNRTVTLKESVATSKIKQTAK